MNIDDFFKELKVKLKEMDNKNISMKKIHVPLELYKVILKKIDQKSFPVSKKKLLYNITVEAHDGPVKFI